MGEEVYLATASAVVTKPVMGSVLSSQALPPEEEGKTEQ